MDTKNIFVVTGFRRSGTSLMASALTHHFGVHFVSPTQLSFGNKNPRGFYEDRILQLAALSLIRGAVGHDYVWHNLIGDNVPIGCGCVNKTSYSSAFKAIIERVSTMFSEASILNRTAIGIKAPLFALVLPCLRDILIKYNLKVIWCARNPLESILSLIDGNTTIIELGDERGRAEHAALLWLQYYNVYMQTNTAITVDYSEWERDGETKVVTKLVDRLSLTRSENTDTVYTYKLHRFRDKHTDILSSSMLMDLQVAYSYMLNTP